ncbi:Pycsar system effector family protein [Jeotgalibacillus proteolyticus]|uniref:Pycsar system effector family protein n=1 Tax=Jeotgalibacillus proteolyticus TaxID=2082395 RepID=UPI003CE7D769
MENEKLFKQLDYNGQWIHNADVKLSIILTFIGVFNGFILTGNEPSIKTSEEMSVSEYLNTFIIVFYLLCLITGFLFSVKGITAKVNNPHPGLWFFGDVAKYDQWHYFHKIKKNQSEEQFEEDLMKQIHLTSKIALKKFLYLNKAIIFTTIALILFFVEHILF